MKAPMRVRSPTVAASTATGNEGSILRFVFFLLPD